MESLVPCRNCRRHIRRHEAECRFCGAERTPSPRPSGECVIPRDVKRATIFALGLALATQACGGKSEGENDAIPSGMGASTGNATGGTGGGVGTDGGGGTGGFAGDGNIDRFPNAVPPYGGIGRPEPDTGGSAGSSGMPDAGPSQDAGAEDAGSDAAPDDAGN